MIRLQVEEYCHNCCEFKPETDEERLYLYGNNLPVYIDVVCVNRYSCEAMYRYLQDTFDKQKGDSND